MNEIETVKLENGLTIYLYEDKRKHTCIFDIITKFGGMSKDYKIDNKVYHFQDGIAHILEHFLVECNKYGNFLDILGKKEMNTNASTSTKITRYYFVTVNNIEFGIKTILKSIYSPVFTEENLEKLKEPIYQEIRGKQTNKFYHEEIKVLDNCFHKLKYRTIGGTLEEVKNTTIEDLKLVYETFYQPENQLVMIAGNFDKESVINTIKEEMKNYTFKKHQVEQLKIKEPKTVVYKKGEILFPTQEDFTEVTYKISLDHLDNITRLKLDFYLYYFSKMTTSYSSPLYKKLIKEKIITGELLKTVTEIDDYLLFSIGAYTKKEQDLVENILMTYQNPIFDEEIFNLEKKNNILEIILRKENLSSMISPFIENVTLYDYPYPDTVEDIENFTLQEMQEIITSLDFSNYTIVSIHPKKNN